MYNPQLETFIRVADAGSFNKAAEELFISPPAVIKQINLLEAQLGLTLFVRTHRGLKLTEAGKSRKQENHSIRMRNMSLGIAGNLLNVPERRCKRKKM